MALRSIFQSKWCSFLLYILPVLIVFAYLHSKIEILQKSISSKTKFMPHQQILNDENLLIFYNRVPKTGSTSFVNAVAYDLCKRNRFNALHLNVTKNKHVLHMADQMRFVGNVTNWTERKPAFYHGHLAFLDFTRFAKMNPIYINIIREPLERFISHYYFLRYGDDFRIGLQRRKAGNTESTLIIYTFDDCVARNGKDCDPKSMWLQIPFFCGHEAFCWQPGNALALEQAKRNLIRHYLLVGLTENIRDFIAILEASLPRFFRGALNHFDSLDESRSHMRNTNKKLAPITETLATMKETVVYRMEFEFYEFVKEQFEFALNRITKYRNNAESATFFDQEFHYEKIKPIL